MPGALDLSSGLVGEDEAGIDEQVIGRDGDSIADGDPDDAVASRVHRVTGNREPGLAGDDEGDERLGFRVDPVEARRVRAQ